MLAETRADTERGLPHGFAVRLAPETKVADGGSTLFGSTTGRLLYLSPPAVRALAGDTVTVVDDTSRSLGRTLLDRDLAHPIWDGGPPRYDDPEGPRAGDHGRPGPRPAGGAPPAARRGARDAAGGRRRRRLPRRAHRRAYRSGRRGDVGASSHEPRPGRRAERRTGGHAYPVRRLRRLRRHAPAGLGRAPCSGTSTTRPSASSPHACSGRPRWVGPGCTATRRSAPRSISVRRRRWSGHTGGCRTCRAPR